MYFSAETGPQISRRWPPIWPNDSRQAVDR